MTYFSLDNKKTAGIVKHSCGIIFVLFSFFYLYFLQGELIAKAQFVFSNGMTSYSIFWGAVIITVILRLLQLPVMHYVKTPIRFHALTYIPSILILTIICDINPHVLENFSLGLWWLGIPLVLIVMYVLVKLANYIDTVLFKSNLGNRQSPFLLVNFIILLCAMLWCGSCHSSTDVDMYEQKVERLVSEGNYEDALKVGVKSFNTNRRLTNLRMYALSRLGILPDRLFDYPQYFGIDGLLCVSDTNSICYRIDANDICNYLGAHIKDDIGSTAQFFEKVINNQQLIVDSLMGIELSRSNNPDSLKEAIGHRYELLKEEKRRIDDYVLCGLLLERKLDEFKEKIDKAYMINVDSDSIVPVDSLPKAYREALVMVYPEIGDTLMLKEYGNFIELKESERDSTISSNITRKKYGKTFWWYYFNPRITRILTHFGH